METIAVRSYGAGTNVDEGGKYETKQAPVPSWFRAARQHCSGCHDDFYNARMNCTGAAHCFSMKPSFAKRKTRPPCFH